MKNESLRERTNLQEGPGVPRSETSERHQLHRHGSHAFITSHSLYDCEPWKHHGIGLFKYFDIWLYIILEIWISGVVGRESGGGGKIFINITPKLT